MKTKLLLFFVAIALVLNCQQRVDYEAEKRAIQTVLDEYIVSIENEDMALYEKNMAHYTDMVNFGAFGKPIVGWEALKKVMESQNEMLSETKITARDVFIKICPSGKFAWATSLWNFKTIMEEKPVEWPVRCTWVLYKPKTVWVIIHFHKSIAAG